MRFTVSAFLGLALLFFGGVAWGQAQPATETEAQKADRAWSNFFLEEVLLRSCEDPTLRSALALPQPKLTLETTEDGKTKLNARVGWTVKRKLIIDLKAESPIDPSEETTLATLEGLAVNGSKLDLTFSWIHWRPKDYYLSTLQDKAKKALEERELAQKKEEARRENNQEAPVAAISSMERVEQEMMGMPSEPTNPKWRITDYNESVVRRPSATAMFGRQKYEDMIDVYQRWMKEHAQVIPAYTLKLNAEQNGFRFFLPVEGPPAGLKETSQSHTDYELTASTGLYILGRTYAAANYRRGTKYTDGKTQEFCSPMGAARILDCTPLVVAPPEKVKPEALELEVRRLFGSIGVGAYVTRDLEANVTIIEVPVYLLQKLGTSKMELNLGARAQWRSDTKDVALSVFLGPALSTVFRMFNM